MDRLAVARAADAIAGADVVIVTAGAGLGVDAGLPDFRGTDGFWGAYPPYAELGMSFERMASPDTFRADPELAWGFYAHRRRLYRDTEPHDGMRLLATWIADAPAAGAAFTSNVDGLLQAAGVDEDALVECHGTIHLDQCLRGCGQRPWEATHTPEVDEATMRAVGDLPACPGCGGLARPNVLMFGDWGWDPTRTDAQERRLARLLDECVGAELTVVEVGAGTRLPTVRRFGEGLVASHGAVLVRIDPREPGGGTIGIRAGGLEALTAIDAAFA
ncbi:MAG: SIR2 family NAD-dependent protein deacylase [Actinomycetes bacterium]